MSPVQMFIFIGIDMELKEVNLSVIDDKFIVSNPSLIAMHQEANVIQDFLEQKVNINDFATLPDRLAKLDAYLHRMSDMQSRAKAMKEYAKLTYISQNEEALSKMTATNSNRVINAALYEFIVTTERMDTMFSSLTQACKNISIQLSWIKKTMDFGG